MLNIQSLPKPSVIHTVRRPIRTKTHVWTPSYLETVIFLDETSGDFKVGLYVDIWNNLRQLRGANDDRLGANFEASPFHNETDIHGNPVFRARVIDLATGFGQWVDISVIGQHSFANIEWSHSQNLDRRAQLAAERLEAFGKVEAA